MREVAPLQDLPPVDVGNRYFRGGDEEIINTLDTEQVLLELRKLAGPGHALPVHHEGRKHFGIVVPLGVEIEHEVYERAFQARTGTPVERKPGAGELRPPFEIKYTKRLADFPVRFRCKRKNRRLAPCPHDDVIAFRRPDRRGFRREIRHRQQKITEGFLDLFQLIVKRLDALRHLAHFDNAVLDLALVLDTADLFGNPCCEALSTLRRSGGACGAFRPVA